MQTPEEYYDFIVHRKESMRYLLNKTEASMLPKPERRKFCLVSIHRMGTRRFQPALRDPSLDIKFTCHLPMAPIIPRAVPGIWTGDIPLSFDRPNLVGKKDKIPQLSCWEFCNSHIFIILWWPGYRLEWHVKISVQKHHVENSIEGLWSRLREVTQQWFLYLSNRERPQKSPFRIGQGGTKYDEIMVAGLQHISHCRFQIIWRAKGINKDVFVPPYPRQP
ncbi:hypothetical protein NLI96_g11693 [Meripilus lineatus]|uniref:Uncharacterized protein n=1 Tax=Meripilus lineatus TaxID=2056292 RepID=A0AAD5UVD6_9APHY|nr:hypothetical protein NLI96_g11693 [Physisporinus lineatus]